MSTFRLLPLILIALAFCSCVDLSLDLTIDDVTAKSGTVTVTYHVAPLAAKLRHYDSSRTLLPLPATLAALFESVAGINGLSLVPGSAETLSEKKGSGYRVELEFASLDSLNALFESSGYGSMELKRVTDQWMFSLLLESPAKPADSVFQGEQLGNYRYLLADIYAYYSDVDPYRFSCTLTAPAVIRQTRPGLIDPDNSSKAVYHINVFDYLEKESEILWDTGW